MPMTYATDLPDAAVSSAGVVTGRGGVALVRSQTPASFCSMGGLVLAR